LLAALRNVHTSQETAALQRIFQSMRKESGAGDVDALELKFTL